MSSLYQKYRPSTFEQVVGQTHIVRTLSNAIKNNRIGHAYLFTGPRGTGKTTLARIFAKAINCLQPAYPADQAASVEPCTQCENCQLIQSNRALDLVEIDAASNTGVDNIRQLKETVVLPPSALKFKVYIIDEVHMLSMGAFNALLKTLEEPPAHAIFILATTELHKIPETILSRCQRFDFSRFSQEQIIKRLKQIAQSEKVKIEDEALETIALEAEGGMRDAESILGQIISLEDKEITTDEVNQILGTSSKRLAMDFVSLIIHQQTAEALDEIEKIQLEGVNLKNFNKNILAYLRNLLILKTNPQASQIVSALTQEQITAAKELVGQASLSDFLSLVDLFSKSLSEFKTATIAQLPLEVAVIEYHVAHQSPTTTAPKTPVAPAPMNPLPSAPPAPTQPAVPSNPTEPTNPPLATPPAPPTTAQPSQPTEPPKSQQTTPVNDDPISTPDEPTEPMPAATAVYPISIELILDKWNDILEGVKPFNHSIHAFLKNCVPAGILDNQLYIKTKYDYYKDKLNEPQNRLTVQSVIAKIIEVAIRVNYVTEKDAERLHFPASATESNNHSILHDAMQMLGGRIVE